MKFSLVFPVYNEAACLENNVLKTMRYLDTLNFDYEIIIAEDNSSDRTYEIGSNISQNYKQVRIIHNTKRRGKGNSLKKAFLIAEGEYVGYMDVDLATDLKHLGEMIGYLGEYDIVTGSRNLKESKAERFFYRKTLSSIYNFLARFLLDSKIYDHQCGIKVFKKDVILKLNKLSKSSHWFWDTETLILGQKLGYKIKEIPVKWKEKRETKVKISADSLDMFLSLIKLKLRM